MCRCVCLGACLCACVGACVWACGCECLGVCVSVYVWPHVCVDASVVRVCKGAWVGVCG